MSHKKTPTLQEAEVEAQELANTHGYCWMWENPNGSSRDKYLAYASDTKVKPGMVPDHAKLFESVAPKEPKLEERVAALEYRVDLLTHALTEFLEGIRQTAGVLNPKPAAKPKRF